MATITHERWKCIGCGACASICPAHWSMSSGKAKLKGAKYEKTDNGEFGTKTVEEAGCCKKAAANCPVKCIHIK
ncbi:MAG: ferredoxin [Nanoarchaeota archaeon]|nr:ferredoxin [Nanoarchaeota archaeon]